MSQDVIRSICKSNPYIEKFLEQLDLKVIECSYIKEFEVDDNRIKGFEAKDNKLIVWHFDADITDKQLCDTLLQYPQIDTLYLGKAVTDNKDRWQITKIHDFLTASHNIIPIIKNIELEDDSNYCVVDGMLIDKKIRSVIDYASGRKETIIHIPDGITSLKEHCFTYNKFVCSLELPTTLIFFDGITSLPNLKFVSIYGEGTSPFVVKDDVIYKMEDGCQTILFIPPCHKTYKPVLEVKTLLKELYNSICDEANRCRWENILSENFDYNHEFNRLSLTYSGGLFQQEWYIEYEELPTKIIMGYLFEDSRIVECNLLVDKYDNCNKCPLWEKCQIVFNRNATYINKLRYEMVRKFDGDIITDDENLRISIDITCPISEVKEFVCEFLDIALQIQRIYHIEYDSIQLSLFPEEDIRGPFIPHFIRSDYKDPSEDNLTPPF